MTKAEREELSQVDTGEGASSALWCLIVAFAACNIIGLYLLIFQTNPFLFFAASFFAVAVACSTPTMVKEYAKALSKKLKATAYGLVVLAVLLAGAEATLGTNFVLQVERQVMQETWSAQHKAWEAKRQPYVDQIEEAVNLKTQTMTGIANLKPPVLVNEKGETLGPKTTEQRKEFFLAEQKRLTENLTLAEDLKSSGEAELAKLATPPVRERLVDTKLVGAIMFGLQMVILFAFSLISRRVEHEVELIKAKHEVIRQEAAVERREKTKAKERIEKAKLKAQTGKSKAKAEPKPVEDDMPDVFGMKPKLVVSNDNF